MLQLRSIVKEYGILFNYYADDLVIYVPLK